MKHQWTRDEADAFAEALDTYRALRADGTTHEWALYEASRLFDITEPALEREIGAAHAWTTIT